MAKIANAEASPTKAFFVRMITRDIALEDCILDLIDNSIDEAWSREGSRPTGLDENVNLSNYKIEITADENGFVITDNCGGMKLETAQHYAFTFGRKQALNNFSIGVYGIGMKRAIFKIGEEIDVRSTYQDGKSRKSFHIPIDVKTWLDPKNANEWDFTIYDAKDLTENGVRISVTRLTPDTSAAFSSKLFQRNLRRTLARDYTVHLRYGLQLVFNGQPIQGWQIELREGAGFRPLRRSYVDKIDGVGSVSVEILAGMAAPPPDGGEADDQTDGDERYGWYAICNGRVVMAADKTAAAGWGTDGWNQWHGQYNGFIGLVFFTSENAGLLPLTTTKRSIDTSSAVFRRARPAMRDASKEWTDYTNLRKQDIVNAKQAESATRSTSIFQIARSTNVHVPILTSKPKTKVANINYSVALNRFRKLADALGNINMTYRDLGIATFEASYQDNVGEDD